MDASRQPVYEVVSPLGRRKVATAAPLASRVPDLSGRTIGFVWDHVFKGDRMFELFEQAASARFSGVRFVRHAEFGNIHGTATEEEEAIARMPDRLTSYGVDVAVVGVGA